MVPSHLESVDEDRYERVRHEYFRLEDSLATLAEYVPLVPDLEAANYKIASPRAAAFGLDCCTWVETLLRELIRDPMMDSVPGIDEARKDDNPSIDMYRRILEAWGQLGSASGVALKGREGPLIGPFSDWAEDRNPEWFRLYSRFKHDRFALADRFTMGDALNAFVALYLLLEKFAPAGWSSSTRESKIIWTDRIL